MHASKPARMVSREQWRTWLSSWPLVPSLMLIACAATQDFPPAAPVTGKRPPPSDHAFRLQ